MDSSLDHGVTAKRYSGTAIISVACAASALLLVAFVPLVGLVVAVAAIVSALIARRELKDNPSMRGFGISLVGFLLGAGIICVKIAPLVIWWVVSLIAGAPAED